MTAGGPLPRVLALLLALAPGAASATDAADAIGATTTSRVPVEPVAPGQCVVVLHGMGRTRASMQEIAADLRHAGYAVVNVSYPARSQPIERLAPRVGEMVARCRRQGATRIHFVTHSLGGIVVRYWLRDHPMADAGRIVMLGPPNRGSEVTEKYRDALWYRFTTGPAGQQIGTGADSVPNQLGAPPLPTGVIAGTRSANPAFAALFGGPNDGKVSVARARMPGLADFLEVDASHYYLTHSQEVLRQVRAFLAHGRFDRHG
jgi:alpha-beta hydrolase superfamily lysophospholipase